MLGRPAGDRAGRQRVGYLPENLRIPRHHTALSALELYGQMSGLSRSEIRQRSGPLLESVDLADRAKDSVRKYSKGMVQRLGLAIALLHEPELVFLDEPTDGLDPAGRAQVRQTLVRLKEAGKTIFLNSHLLQEVELVCDRVAILDRDSQGHRHGGGTGAAPGPGHRAQVTRDADRPAAVRAALSGMPQARIESQDAEHHQIQVCLHDQADVDRCVDALRQQAMSIDVPGPATHQPGRSVHGSAGTESGQAMKPYLAIIADSFREALASRVLWILLILITLVLVALLPLGYRAEQTTEFRPGRFPRRPRSGEGRAPGLRSRRDLARLSHLVEVRRGHATDAQRLPARSRRQPPPVLRRASRN